MINKISLLIVTHKINSSPQQLVDCSVVILQVNVVITDSGHFSYTDLIEWST